MLNMVYSDKKLIHAQTSCENVKENNFKHFILFNLSCKPTEWDKAGKIYRF